MKAWERVDVVPCVAHGGPPEADHQIVMTWKEKQIGNTLQLDRKREPASINCEQPDSGDGTLPTWIDMEDATLPRPSRNALGQSMDLGSFWQRVQSSSSEQKAPAHHS